MDNTTVHPTSADLSHLTDLFLFQGRPVNNDPNRPVEVLVNHGYVVGFSRSRLQPVWAGYRVAFADRDVDFDRPHLYYDDSRLADDLRVGADTFGKHDGVGYHVGHMVPNEVINRQFGRLAQMETFLMSNMSPQRGSLNTGPWLKLENQIRNIEDTSERDHVWAIVGPIFDDDPDFIQRPNGQSVPIPESYYCITVDPFRYPWDRPGNVDIVCFRVPQDAPSGTDLSTFVVSLPEIQNATNLSFFPNWPEGAALDDDSRAPAPAADTRHRLLRRIRREEEGYDESGRIGSR